MKKQILFLAANPAGTTPLNLDEEARAIQEEIQRAAQRDQFEFVTRMAVRPLDLLRALRDLKPTIVHFAGHAGVDGVYLTREDGLLASVTRDTLVATFGAAGQSVQTVVLNGCSTETLAEAMCEFLPVCVGTSAPIGDDAARMFSIGFYGALAAGESTARACLHGNAAMHLAASSNHDRPHLRHRRDVDPDTLILANRPGSVSPAPAAAPVHVVFQSPAAVSGAIAVAAPAGLVATPSRDGTDRAAEPWCQLRASDVTAVVAAYRARKSGSFERWDLRTAGPAPTTNNRPAEITLDEMYIPLRFATQLDPSRLDRGAPISPDDLLRHRRPRVLIGGAGSGKTTWMRWTFRRLIRDPRVVPFFLELRAIAAAWKTPQEAGRPVDRYLVDELTACGVADATASVVALLSDPSGSQPVILIDGWDELGAQGERLRERLVEFCRAFPRAVVVVSSRPYGETRPAGAEAFETLHIQPLSDGDIRLLATHFHRRVHGLDEPAGARATEDFLAALAAAPEARSLAGTALLLTMMLLLSREGPLPDRRHKLYTACLRNMLLHRVTQRERDGAVVALDQWRPDDSEERLRVVAELAYRMQTEGYEKSRRALMVRAWDDAIGLLGGEWTQDQRERFLRWLVATAGILIDRTDGSVQFTHLSFQEHLAAYYLFITREGDERVAAVRVHMDDRDWWETLRLWAGLTGDHWPDKLSPVFSMLRSDTSGYWLAGEIFADGTGHAHDFEIWATALSARLSDPFGAGDGCAQAWGACKQSSRRAVIARRLAAAREGLHWLDATWHAHWCRLANLEVEPAPSLLALEAPIDSAGAAARSRVLLGGAASWPDGGELAMLRLWPSVRAATGIRLQTAISLGAEPVEVVALLPALLARAARSWSGEDHILAEDFARHLAQYFVRYLGWDLGQDFSQYLGRDFARYFVRYFLRDLDRDCKRYLVTYVRRGFDGDFARDFERAFVRYLAQDFGSDFVRGFGRDFVRYFVRSFRRDFIRDFVRSEPMLGAPWLPAFAFLEAGSVVGRTSPRAALGYGEVPTGVPLLALFRAACQASFAPDDASLSAAVVRACDTFDGDPLWPALARHVARISTSGDQALLEDLARHPEQREPPLSWGLQHYVRGDLVFGDDSVITLDDLCAQAGLAPLPLLEAMPDELDLSFDGASP